MAKKEREVVKAADEPRITRVKAVETAPRIKKQSNKASKSVARTKRPTPKIFTPFVSLGGYFKGAWEELRQVRWPTRRATWSLTGAVLAFTAFFVILILLLDAGFKLLFDLILK
ncbi:MAG: secE [Candidatus Saccharibacteria bacterium]|nr:secE [Candidatus Saccharibacteria bacterium]